jgi:glutathione peroxidase
MRFVALSALSLAALVAGAGGLLPALAGAPPDKNLVETATAAGTFQTLVKALGEAGLAKTLEGRGPFTVFAPTDEAFAKLPAGAFDSLSKDPKKLKALVGYHVLAGQHLAKELGGSTSAKTLEGSEVRFGPKGAFQVDGAKVTQEDLRATNGVIHVIDAVLVPPSLRADPAFAKGDADSLYALTVTTLEGKELPLSTFQGKVTLVVNVASECGFTPQYAGLQKLHAELADRGFSVLGFPSNEFGGQEPGDAAGIRKFCDSRYGVTFPLFAKVVTQAGADQSPVYALLTKGRPAPSWNFCKYLVGKDGKVIAFYESAVTPVDPGLRRAIEAALK